jgi:fimbrial isopeptide formation D2 family protein
MGSTVVDGTTFTNIALSAPATATKTWVDVSVSVTPPSATNLAGDPHTFTVHVNVAGADGTATPLPANGATVAFTFTGPGTETANTCATGTTAGTCVVTFANSGAGSGTFTATSVTVTVNGTPLTVDLTTAGANGQAPGQVVPPTAAKTWVAYHVTVSPSANNPVGTEHNFVITATVTDGTTTGPAANASIVFTWTGAGTLVTPSPCTTNQNGTCTVSVTSTSAGTGTLTVMSLTNSAGATVDLTAPGMPGQSPVQVVPVESTKTWLQYRVLLSASATNLTGVPHTFTATVQQTGLANPTPADWTTVPNGTMLNVSSSGVGSLDPASSCLTPGTTGGTCQFVVHDAGPGTITLQVNSIGSTVVDGVTYFDIGLSAPATASKTWIAYTVTLSPSATNPQGTQHDFVITATMTDGTTTTPAVGASIAFTWSGSQPTVPASPCTTSAAGTCTVTVTSPAAGSGTLTVTSLTDSGGRVVNLTVAGAPGQATNQVVPLATSKTWLQYRVLLNPPSATNLTGVSHTLTATVQQTGIPNPTNSDWTAVPDGTTLAAAPTPTSTGTLDPTSSCLTAGTTGGTCQFIVHDAGPGTLTLDVTAIGATSIGGIQFTDIPLSAPATATKTWVAYTVTLSPSATNLAGMPHNFVITATMTDGTTTSPAAGASIAFTWSGAQPSTPASPCMTGPAGTCTVTVNSSTAGSGTLTVTSLTDSGGRVVDLTTEGANGQALNQVVPLTATKTWTGWTLEIKKASSVTDSTQPFSFTTTGFAPPNDAPFQLTVGQSKEFSGLAVGTFTVAEDTATLPAPWRFESLSCTGAHDNASVRTDGPTATLTIGGPSPTGPPPGGLITCTYTNEQMNLVVRKTDGGATPVEGGDPFNYTITVTNEGSVATSDPVTVVDTLGPGLAFAGTPTISAGGGSCAPPAGRTLTCTLTAPIAAGATVTIVVPARVLMGTVGPVRNDVTIDSPEDPLCPDGVCPPPPECPEPVAPAGQPAAVRAETVAAADPPSDNQDCVLTLVTGAGAGQIVPPPTTAPEVTGPPLARTGADPLPAALGGLFFLAGVGLIVVEHRRRARFRT